MVSEISGIADGSSNSIWAIEDSGNPPELLSIKHDGQLSKKIFLKNITNRDWEDIAILNGSIIIAETGDNALQYPEYRLYIFNEPDAATDTVHNIQTIKFNYPDGSNDCEAIIADPATSDVYFFTKSSQATKVYRLTYPYDASSVQTLTFLGSLNLPGIVSATITPPGNEVILKSYTTLYYYKRAAGENVFQAVSKSAQTIPYLLEPQGEAVSFAADNSGYYTLSEKGFSSQVWLYKYKRN